MAIEFRCLNCRNTLVADESDAGEKTECDQCGICLTIPLPIGGELTDKRLRGSTALPSPSVRISTITSEHDLLESSAGVATALAPAEVAKSTFPKYVDQRYFDLDDQPSRGFKFGVRFPDEAMYQEEFDPLVRSAAEIRSHVLAHFEQLPQYFERGSLVLVINRCRADHEGYDVSIRLVGLLNDLEISHYFHAHPRNQVAWRGGLYGLFGIVMVKGIDYLRWTYLPGWTQKRFHQWMVRAVVLDLTTALDEAVDRPISTWQKLVRSLTSG